MEADIMNNRTEFVEKLSSQIVEWDTQIERLKDKAESASPEESFEYSGSISALQLKRDEAAEKLQGISTASDHEWDDLKAGTERVWGEVRSILRDTITKIK